jgi:seryl-tRNA synthetase
MLQLAVLRNNPDSVKERLAVRNFKEPNLVDEIIALDDSRKKLTFQFDETKARINAASKEIGGLMAKGQKEEAEGKKKEVETLKATLGPVQEEPGQYRKAISDLLVRLPNLPSPQVPRAKRRKTMKWFAPAAASPNCMPALCRIGTCQKI